MPDDLKKAAELLHEASVILAKHLASDAAPRMPSKFKVISEAMSAAQQARSFIGYYPDECRSQQLSDLQFE